MLAVGSSDVDPGDDRRLDVNDAVALVGWHNFKPTPGSAPTDAIVFHCGAGVTVKLGGADASEPPALNAELVRLKAAIASAAATETGSAGLGGMTALKAALDALSPGWPTAPTKVTVK
jgi:hypothetical protein